MESGNTRFMGTLGGALVDMQFGYAITDYVNDALKSAYDRTQAELTPQQPYQPNTAACLDAASEVYDELVSSFDDIESDLNDEWTGETLELAQEHLDLAFHALDTVRIHMARLERLLFPEDRALGLIDQHSLSDCDCVFSN